MITSPTTHFAPGPWTLMVLADRWLLLDLPTEDPDVLAVWALFSSGARDQTLLDLLLERRPSGPPGLALVTRTGVGLAVTVRHPARVDVDGDQLASQDDDWWTTASVPVASFALSTGHDRSDAPPPCLPLGLGVVPAGAVAVVPSSHEAQGGPPAPAREPGPAVAGEFSNLLRGTAVVPEPAASESTSASLDDDGSSSKHDDRNSTQWWLDAPEAPDPTPPTSGAPEPVSTPVAGPAIDTPQESALGQPETGEPWREGTVLASRCEVGHWTPAHAPDCRICGTTVPPQSPHAIARPSLGFLHLESGDSVEVDRGVVLGRAPRGADGTHAPPRLVELRRFGGDISRMHAEVVLDGWNVLVRDLGSSNGTVHVSSSHGTRTRLLAHELHPLVLGDTVELAGVTAIRFLPTASGTEDRR